MRVVIPVAEQLDRAGRELADGRPVSGRIALILVDNALELMCHRKAEDILTYGARGKTLSTGQRADLRGQDFNAKIAVLRALGHVPQDQARAAATFHRHRNQLYHVGLRDDPVVGDLARLYYELAVGLMPGLLLAERHLRWEPSLLDDTARRLLPELETNTRYRNKVSIGDLAGRLLAALPPSRNIPPAFQAHLLARIDLCEADFKIIAGGRSGKDDPDETLRRVQLEHDTVAAVLKKRREDNRALRRAGLPERPIDEEMLSLARGLPIMIEANARLLPGWKPAYPKRPFDLWRKQSRAVGQEALGLKAFERFDRVIRQIEGLDEVMAEPIEDMHGWNQHMEDVMMDSR